MSAAKFLVCNATLGLSNLLPMAGSDGRRVAHLIWLNRKSLHSELFPQAFGSLAHLNASPEPPEQSGRMFAIQFDKHTLRLTAEGRSSADRRGQDNSAARGHVASLDNRPFNRPEESIADGLRHHRQVHVEESRVAGIDTSAQVRVRLIGRAEADGIGVCQCAVKRRTSGGAGDDADLERCAALMCCFGAIGDRSWYRFRRPAAVNPLKPIVCPCSTCAAASSGVSLGNGNLIADLSTQ